MEVTCLTMSVSQNSHVPGWFFLTFKYKTKSFYEFYFYLFLFFNFFFSEET